MVKLFPILFLSEAVPSAIPFTELSPGEEHVINQLQLALSKSTSNLRYSLGDAAERAAGGKILNGWQVARRMYLQNKDKLKRIIGSPEKFRFLGGGSWGIAFEIEGDRILKLEAARSSRGGIEFSAEDRTNMAVSSLWKTEKKPSSSKLGRAVPMVYDHGTIQIFGVTVFWAIMEKMETGSGGDDASKPFGGSSGIQKWRNMLNEVLDEIKNGLVIAYYREKVADKSLSQKQLKEIIKEVHDKVSAHISNLEVDIGGGNFKISDMEDDLKLTSDWLKRLVTDMVYLMNESIDEGSFDTDFHAGNLGIRRISGFEGYFVYFD
jgi:hypothetical protein